MGRGLFIIALIFMFAVSGVVSAENSCSDSDGGLDYDEKGTVTLTGSQETLEERGLEFSDGLVVTSSTTAILKLNNEVKNVTLGQEVAFPTLTTAMTKINIINYYSGGNESNNIIISVIMRNEDFCVEENILTEYSCLNNNINSVNYSCDYGCNNGKCSENSCVNSGYKCTSAIRGCGHYEEKNLNCPGGNAIICCSEIPFCGDGVCFEHNNVGYGETATNCPEDCAKTYEILIRGQLIDQISGEFVSDAKLISAYEFSPSKIVTDDMGNFVFNVKTDFRLKDGFSEPETLEERGLESSDGLVVTSSTTAILKLDNEVKNVTLGETYIFSVSNNDELKVEKINYVGDGNSENNIKIRVRKSEIGGQWTFFKECYDYAYISLQKDCNGCSMILMNNAFDQEETVEDISGKGTVDLGKLKIYPNADISITSDIKASFNVMYKYKNIDGYNGPGQSGYTVEHYLSNALPLNYDVFIQFEDEFGNEYKSSTYRIPVSAKCGIIHLSYFDGESKWLVLSEIVPDEETGPIDLPDILENIDEDSEVIDILCLGCTFDKKCYPFGYRKSGNYCSDNLEFVGQLDKNIVCDNNFECKSNVCVSGKCVSEGLIKKILNWFRKLFG